MNKKVKKWFIVQIKPNSYDLASRNLVRQGFEIFSPKMSITKRKNNKFFLKEVLVFPGYIFVSFNPSLVKLITINSTYGVSKILSFNKKPAEISSDLVLRMQDRYIINHTISENNLLQKGDNIKIYSGPFADFFAKVENVSINNRIWVILEYSGKRQKLNLDNNIINYMKV